MNVLSSHLCSVPGVAVQLPRNPQDTQYALSILLAQSEAHMEVDNKPLENKFHWQSSSAKAFLINHDRWYSCRVFYSWYSCINTGTVGISS